MNEYLSFQKKEKKKSLLFEFQEIQLIFEECRLQHPATKERKEKQHSFEEIRWYFELTIGFLFGGFLIPDDHMEKPQYLRELWLDTNCILQHCLQVAMHRLHHDSHNGISDHYNATKRRQECLILLMRFFFKGFFV